MKKHIVFAALLMAAFGAFGQKEQTLLGSSGFRFTGIWGGWTSALSRFGDQTGYVRGGFFGAEFGKSVFIGGAGYSLSNGANWNGVFTPQRFNLDYGGLMVGAGINNWKLLHPQFNVTVGGGEVWLQGEGRDAVFAVQPQVGVELNVARWFHLGVEGGYRYVVGSDYVGLSDRDLSSPFIEAKMKFGWSWGGSAHRRKNDRD